MINLFLKPFAMAPQVMEFEGSSWQDGKTPDSQPWASVWELSDQRVLRWQQGR